MKKVVAAGLVIMSLAACTTKGQAVQQAEKAMKNEWSKTPVSANQETDQFAFYCPSKLKVLKSGANNVILADSKGKPFILFVNRNEGPKSQVNYKEDLNGLKDSDRVETIHDKKAFSYLVIKSLGKHQYELIMDRGGVKMSTKTTLDQVGNDSQLLTKVIHSVTLKGAKDES